MMRSLWSGVSGLRVHQVGMDVEGNNIANVNTYGFKYSRVNYSTMFSQTMSIATQPTDNTGGQNAKQVGLGVMAAATQRIHSQGSISGTDSNYDVAIEGNGFFLVSNDGGKTRYLTRDGAFNQDAAGNFVNSNGYIVQGWVRDPVTGNIDTALSPGNLSWDPAMNLPANPSSSISLNAQLNSGSKITQTTSRYIYSLDALHGGRITGTLTYPDDMTEDSNQNNQFYTTSKNALDITEKSIDFAAVYSGSTYENLNLRSGQSFWFSYADATYTTQNNANLFNQAGPITAAQNGVIFWGDNIQSASLNITLNGVTIQGQVSGIEAAATLINQYQSQQGTINGTGVRAEVAANGKSLIFTNQNANGTTDNMKNINLVVNPGNTAGEFWDIDANNTAGATARTEAQYQISADQHAGGATKTAPNLQGSAWMSNAATATDVATAADFDKQVITAHRYEYSTSAVTISKMSDPVSGNAYNDAEAGNVGTASNNYIGALFGGLLNTNSRRFHSTEDLRELMQRDARYGVDYSGSGTEARGTANHYNNNVNHNVTLTVDNTGRYVFTNPAGNRILDTMAAIPIPNGQTATFGDLVVENNTGAQINFGGIAAGAVSVSPKNMYFQASSYSNENAQISSNDALTSLFKTFQGELSAGNSTKTSTNMVLSSFTTSLEMYDSLGTKHLLRVEWSKHETTLDGGTQWQMLLRIDEPATFNNTGSGRNNIIVGSVRFGNDGSLTSYTPTEITFSGNNGSAPNQLVTLNLGANGAFNGLVSNEQTSAISLQQTDGYAPGVLKQGMQNMSIDSNGIIYGSFTNGITMAMGQIAMGNVVNEAGLQDVGDNLYTVSSNSGTLTIGAPNVGGRGSFKSGALELSNADLSLSLTNLIVIQRGYQANSKTITTSDTMLNTLLQLKQ